MKLLSILRVKCKYKSYVFVIVFILSIYRCKKEHNYIKDIDGNLYSYIKIDKTYWFQENLKTTHFQNGDNIINIKEDSTWINLKSPAMCFYNNDLNNKKIYGALYNWYVASDSRNVCPKGWKVPSRKDYYELSAFYGGDAISSKYLKTNDNNLWTKQNISTSNKSKFKAIPSGHRNYNSFERLGTYALYWTNENYLGLNCIEDDICAYEFYLNNLMSLNLGIGHKYRGMAIRCIKEKAPNKR